MSDFVTIMEANCKPPRTRRKPLMDDNEVRLLDKAREARIALQKGLRTIVVISYERSFEEVFMHYSPVMKIYAKKGELLIKTIDQVVAEDLESCFVEFDK